MGQFGRGLQQTQSPLYGQGQIASYLQGLNGLANSSIQSLQGQLARSGALNSGRLSAGATDIGLNRNNQASNFMSQVPLWNRQAQLSGAQTYGGLGNSLLSLAPRTQTSNQSGNSSGQSQQQTIQQPSILSDIGQGLGIAGSIFGMPSFEGLLGGGGSPGGGGGSSGFNNILNPYAGYSGASSPFGAQVGGGLGGGIPSWLPGMMTPPGGY
jgi:hypothetical protein